MIKKIEKEDALMTISEFEASCLGGYFIDYDGFGVLSNGETYELKPNETLIYPSMVKEGKLPNPLNFTHVVWFNR